MIYLSCILICVGSHLTFDIYGQTEFMVDMKCEGCVKSVKNKLQTVDGNHFNKVALLVSSIIAALVFLFYMAPTLLLNVSLLGVKNVDVDLTNQVVRVLGTSPVKIMTEALEQTGRKARLIGQGLPDGES